MQLNPDLEEKAKYVLTTQEPTDRSGSHSDIYSLGDSYVIKLFWTPHEDAGNNSNTLWGNAEWEFKVGGSLLEGGVSVPRMFGLGEIEKRFPDSVYTCSFLVMEKIEGLPVGRRYLGSDDLNFAVRQFWQQLERAEQLGFKDETRALWLDAIFNQETRRLFLFDLVPFRGV